MFAFPLTAAEESRFLERASQPGAVFVYPTESVYALGCFATDPAGAQKIFQLKQRDANRPLLVLAASLAQVQGYTDPLSQSQREFLEEHWPGPLSVVLPACGLAEELNPQGSEVAFRVPADSQLTQLIERSGVPWVGTSANLSHSPASTDLSEIQNWLGDRVSLYLQGPCPGGPPSTVIRLDAGGRVQVLRPGKWTAP